MKGNPESPQCGFSSKVTEILKSWKVPFQSFDVLSDESIRQGIKDYANWPTIPQLYINKEFVGVLMLWMKCPATVSLVIY
ncbi:MAG: hypothetical protein Ct9H300mP28_10430 [Pseudomonadota bacterium]|nr:MAG: hypothetical protein Ct9H300mP28_10430 [Pseudomonadota bacterium]